MFGRLTNLRRVNTVRWRSDATNARWVFIVALLAVVAADRAHGQFIPGHVFVAETAGSQCVPHDDAGGDQIWEIDPETGQATLFVQIPQNMCGFLTGLAFTPDGSRLRAAFWLRSEILEFDSEGNFTVVLDSADGIACPWGFNNLAYDASGNFYVAHQCPENILRFPADGGPPSVFADATDWVGRGGAIAFAADSALYLTTSRFPLNIVVRITPDGMGSVFDSFGGIISPEGVTADKSGHVYVGLETGEVFRYDAGNPASKELLAVFPFGGRHSLTMSPDQSKVYVNARGSGPTGVGAIALWSIDVVDGGLTKLAVVDDGLRGSAAGSAVVPVPPPPIPTVSHWGTVVMILLLLTAGTLVLIRRRDVLRPRREYP